MTLAKLATALFSLTWVPMTDSDRRCWAGAGEDAYLAQDSEGNTYCRSVVDGELLIDVIDSEGEPSFNGKMEAF